jgi:thiol-disulfide isomerase/thioredoxin
MKKFMRLVPLLSGILFLAACQQPLKNDLKTGIWRGVIELQGQELPFTFDILKDSAGGYDAVIKNANEKLLLEEILLFDDSVSLVMHIFDAQLRARIRGDSLTGFFTHNYAVNYRLPFKAKFNQNFRFEERAEPPTEDFTGSYAIRFYKTETEHAPAIGLFKQNGSSITGTFIRPSGDYRYLEGIVYGDSMRLSGFDGNHLFVFSALKSGDSLTGDFWSGKTRHDRWTGVINDNASLPDGGSVTYLKEGYDKVDFKFPDVDGNIVSPSDEKYKNKVVILQLFGTWCPNCMDETRFLAPWYEKNKDRGVEIIGLAYEQKDDFSYASNRVKLMKERLGVNYDFVIGGVNDNAKASETLPMLNRVAAFPTTIFVGKDGLVKHIHTGFAGPSTGIYHERYIEEFNQLINELLAEKVE